MVWPFPSSKKSHFQNEASAKPFLWKWLSFIWVLLLFKNHSHINGFTLSLSLKQRLGQEKWPPVGVWPHRVSLTCPWLLFSDSNESVLVIQYNFGMNKGLLTEFTCHVYCLKKRSDTDCLSPRGRRSRRNGKESGCKTAHKISKTSSKSVFLPFKWSVGKRPLATSRSLSLASRAFLEPVG